MKPTAPLMIEHRLIERTLAALFRHAQPAVKQKQLDTAFVDAAVDFVRWYADKTHHGKEESILFRDAAKKDLSTEDRRLMQDLIAEHEFGRKTVGELAGAKERYIRGEDGALTAFLNAAEKLLQFYREHIRKEDTIFFPASMRYFSEQEQTAMLDEFRESDSKMIHAKYGAVVDLLEKTAQ